MRVFLISGRGLEGGGVFCHHPKTPGEHRRRRFFKGSTSRWAASRCRVNLLVRPRKFTPALSPWPSVECALAPPTGVSWRQRLCRSPALLRVVLFRLVLFLMTRWGRGGRWRCSVTSFIPATTTVNRNTMWVTRTKRDQTPLVQQVQCHWDKPASIF